MNLRIFAITFYFFSAFSLSAQLGGGVKIGLNFSNIKGPSELGLQDVKLEQMDNYTGFMIGPSFAYSFTDNFGLRGEFLYSKKGMKYSYEGPTSRTFLTDGDLIPIATSGTSKINYTVNHTCMDIPLMAFARYKKFEVSGGFYASMLFARVADGIMEYKWINADGSERSINPLLQYNYTRDKFGEGDNAATITALLNESGTRKATLPKTFGAYYDDKEDRGNKYSFLDYGVSVGASFFMNQSLFIGGRLQYGLADLTRTNADVSISQKNTDGTAVLRADKDHNYTFQVYVGFSLR
jgi:hypothetical protein